MIEDYVAFPAFTCSVCDPEKRLNIKQYWDVHTQRALLQLEISEDKQAPSLKLLSQDSFPHI